MFSSKTSNNATGYNQTFIDLTMNGNKTSKHERRMNVGAYGEELTFVDVLGLIMVACLVCCVIGGNVFVISAFVRVERKMKTITNYFIVSLAVSDILVGVISIPFWMVMLITRSHFSSVTHIVFVVFDIMLGVASITNLTIISLERLFAVVRPASHRNLTHQTKLVFYAIAAVWAFGLFNSSLFFVKLYYGWVDYDIYIVIIGFVLPALIIVRSYLVIYKVALRHVSQQKRFQQEIRLAGMIAIVIVLFFICWFPFFLINILYTYCSATICDHVLLEKTIPFVKFLHYSNSMMNPIVYAYRNSDYRQVFKNIFYSVMQRSNTRQRSASATSPVTGGSGVEETNFNESTHYLSVSYVSNNSMTIE